MMFVDFDAGTGRSAVAYFFNRYLSKETVQLRNWSVYHALRENMAAGANRA